MKWYTRTMESKPLKPGTKVMKKGTCRVNDPGLPTFVVPCGSIGTVVKCKKIREGSYVTYDYIVDFGGRRPVTCDFTNIELV